MANFMEILANRCPDARAIPESEIEVYKPAGNPVDQMKKARDKILARLKNNIIYITAALDGKDSPVDVKKRDRCVTSNANKKTYEIFVKHGNIYLPIFGYDKNGQPLERAADILHKDVLGVLEDLLKYVEAGFADDAIAVAKAKYSERYKRGRKAKAVEKTKAA